MPHPYELTTDLNVSAAVPNLVIPVRICVVGYMYSRMDVDYEYLISSKSSRSKTYLLRSCWSRRQGKPT